MSLDFSRSADTGARAALHYDFCPWANQYVYWLKKPIGWLFTAAATAAMLGIYVSPQAFAVSAVVLGLIALGMLWPAVAMRGIDGKLTWQRHRSVEGEPIETVLEVTNRWPWPVWGLMVEADSQVVNDGSGFSSSVALECLRPFSTTQFVWDSKPTERGVFPEKEAYLTTGFPFGIWTSKTSLAIPNSLTVWPEAIELHDMPSLSGDNRSIVGAWIDKAGHEGDVIGVRPFRDGDSLRNVHWAQSAKSSSLIVCERQSVARRSIRLRIDNLPSLRKLENEWLIRIGGSMAKAFLAHQWSVELEIGGKVIAAEPGDRGLRNVMDTLATFDRNHAEVTDPDGTKGFEPKQTATDRKRALEASLYQVSPDTAATRPFHNDTNVSKTGESRLRKRKSGRSDRLEIVITTTDRASCFCSDSRASHSKMSWVLINSLEGSCEYEQNIKPWMFIDLRDPVWAQVQSQWVRVCHANTSMVTA